MVRSKLAKLSKWKECLPLAEESADLIPNQAMRMVANDRKRFWPIASKKPRFWVSKVLMAWKIVGLHSRQLLRRPGVYLPTLTACGRFEVNWEVCLSPAT